MYWPPEEGDLRTLICGQVRSGGNLETHYLQLASEVGAACGLSPSPPAGALQVPGLRVRAEREL